MAARIPPLPPPTQPVVMQGGVMDPAWHQWFTALQKILTDSGIAYYDFVPVDLGTLAANATFKFNPATKKFTPTL